MDKRFILATLAGMLTIAVVGGLLYGVVCSSFFKANILDLSVMRNPPGFAWIALSHVPFGILLVLAVSWRGELSMRGGAVTGGLLGFLMAASYDLSQFGTLRHDASINLDRTLHGHGHGGNRRCRGWCDPEEVQGASRRSGCPA